MRLTLATSVMVSAALAATVPQHTGRRNGMSIPIAKRRSELVNADKSVDFHTLSSYVASVNAKITRGLKNYEHNTGTRHPFSVKTVEKRANRVPLTDNKVYDGWYGTIYVGTPPERFTVLFDTGSSDFILPTSACSSCEGHSLWDPPSSSTVKMLNKPFEMVYGDASAVTGILYNDTVYISDFIAIDQTLAGATTYSPHLAPSKFDPDGFMGLAFRSISRSNARPIIETLAVQKQVDKSLFSFKLLSPGAELYIGGTNSALYTGSFTYVPVTKEAHWQVNIDNIQGFGQTALSDVAAVIDTGTDLIHGIYAEVSALYGVLGGTDVTAYIEYDGLSYYSFACDSFPIITLTFGGTSFAIPPSDLNIGRVSANSLDCICGIVSNTEEDDPFWVIGHIFLQNVYTTFDYANSQVGFAQLAT